MTLFLKLKWSNGAQTTFDIYDQHREHVGVATQHADLHTYVHSDDIESVEGKCIMEAMETFELNLKQFYKEKVIALRNQGSLINAMRLYKSHVDSNLRLDVLKRTVEAL